MNKGKFTFDLLDKYTPDIVIRNVLKELERDTKGYVKGNIQKYDGEVYSYTLLHTEDPWLTSKEVDIQRDLGEQYPEQHKFEVFLTVKGLEHYKYRMMFVDYGTISYPVNVIMNEDLAIAYSGKRKDVFTVESMKKLEEMMDSIFNSDMMISLIQSLINESLRQEMKEIS